MPSNQRTTISRRQQLRDQRARESAKETKRRRLFRIATGLLTTLIVALIGFGMNFANLYGYLRSEFLFIFIYFL